MQFCKKNKEKKHWPWSNKNCLHFSFWYFCDGLLLRCLALCYQAQNTELVDLATSDTKAAARCRLRSWNTYFLVKKENSRVWIWKKNINLWDLWLCFTGKPVFFQFIPVLPPLQHWTASDLFPDTCRWFSWLSLISIKGWD